MEKTTAKNFPCGKSSFKLFALVSHLTSLLNFFFSELILLEYLGDEIYGRVSIRRFGEFSKLGRFELVAESSQGG